MVKKSAYPNYVRCLGFIKKWVFKWKNSAKNHFAFCYDLYKLLDLSKITCKEKSSKFFPKYLLSLASPLCIIWLMCAWPKDRDFSIAEFQSWGALYFLFLKNIINLCFLVPLLSKRNIYAPSNEDPGCLLVKTKILRQTLTLWI